MGKPSHNKFALPVGTKLRNYTIVDVPRTDKDKSEHDDILGGGGFGIVYKAKLDGKNSFVAIKEYFPRDFVIRSNGIVHARQGYNQEFEEWKTKFKQECVILNRCRHPGIIKVFEVFEMNQTVYLVMEYIEGKTLKDFIVANQKPISERLLSDLLFRVLEGLSHVHSKRLTHRDIKPDNIYITAKGDPLLLDFGAARYTIDENTKSLTAIHTPGFAPLEQTGGGGQQGPWTDIYAMSGTILAAMMGVNPPNANTRGMAQLRGVSPTHKFKGKFSDDFISVVDQMSKATKTLIPKNRVPNLKTLTRLYSPEFLQAVDKGFQIDYGQRPKTNSQWWELFRKAEKVAPKPRNRRFKLKYTSRFFTLPLIGLASAIILMISLFFVDLPGWDFFSDRTAGEFQRAGKFKNFEGQEFIRIPGSKNYLCTTEVTRASFSNFVQQENFTQNNLATHRIQIRDRGRWIQKSSVTWKKGMSFIPQDNHPVSGLNWYDCQAYIKWLNQTGSKELKKRFGTNAKYRLPLDLEWSKAVGLKNEQGATPEARHRNFSSHNHVWQADIPYQKYVIFTDRTRPVKSGQANQNGYYNMIGNVSEWIEGDLGSVGGSRKFLRGGGFAESGTGDKCAYCVGFRDAPSTHFRKITQGIRIAIQVN